MADLELLLTQNDRVVRRIAPDDLQELPGAIRLQVNAVAEQIKERLVRSLRRQISQEVRGRDLNPDYQKGGGQQLMVHINQALANSRIDRAGGEVMILVFDLLHMDLATRDEGRWTEGEGWFMKRIREGSAGTRTGHSYAYGFIKLDMALQLAQEASSHDKESERQKFLTYVRVNFAGRHGEGIMVGLDNPLFFTRPNFGTARDHGVVPHPGYIRWTFLKDVDATDNARDAARNGGQHWILDLLERAVSKGMRS